MSVIVAASLDAAGETTDSVDMTAYRVGGRSPQRNFMAGVFRTAGTAAFAVTVQSRLDDGGTERWVDILELTEDGVAKAIPMPAESVLRMRVKTRGAGNTLRAVIFS